MARPKALEKAFSVLQGGDFYEAQQMIKTVYHRQRARKQLVESYATLQEGAKLQLQARQATCGVELGLMLIDAYLQDNVKPDVEGMKPALDLITAFPDRSGSEGQGTSKAGAQDTSATSSKLTDVDEYSRLVNAIMKWATKFPRVSTVSSQQVHAAFAEYLWKQYGMDQLARVSAHAMRSGLPQLQEQVIRIATPPGALPQCLTQAVLQTLAIARPDTKSAQLEQAKGLWKRLAPTTCPGASQAPHGADGDVIIRVEPGSPYPPLVNFLGLLLEAIAKPSAALVKLLRDRYSQSLSADPYWGVLLDRIESVHLGVKKSGGLLGGPLGGLFSQLMSGMGEPMDDDDDSDHDAFEDAQDSQRGNSLDRIDS